MVDWLSFLQVFVFFNPYYILPSIFSGMVFLSQWRERANKKLIILLMLTAGIFSISLSFEYILIFLITESLPESLPLRDKLIIGAGITFSFLVILCYATEGTRIGTWISKFLNKYFWQGAIIVPVSPFTKQLGKLQELKEKIMIGDGHQLEKMYTDFLENGASILIMLQKTNPKPEQETKVLQEAYENCEQNFISLCNGQHTNELRIKTAGSVSKFIGMLDAFK